MGNESASLLLQVQDWLLRPIPASGVRRVLPVLAALGSDVGAVRKENQDRLALARGRDRFGHLYVVVALADGIGGMRYGAQCAALAVSAVFDAVHRLADSDAQPSEWVSNAVDSAHKALRTTYGGTGGATLVLLLVTEHKGVYWASVGDSRLYLLTAGALHQISKDDTIAGQLGRPAGADVNQGKLIQYVGMDGSLELNVTELSCTSDSTAVLTTDGVHFLALESNIMSLVVRHAPDIGAIAKRLTELARWAGGPDNATVAVLSLDTSKYESLPAYACLDIWDPFGEIRLPLSVQERQRIATSTAISSKSTVTTSDTSTENVAITAQPVIADENVSRKTKAIGGKGKARKRKPRSPRDAPIPQVQLEFSNKKS